MVGEDECMLSVLAATIIHSLRQDNVSERKIEHGNFNKMSAKKYPVQLVESTPGMIC